MSLTDISLMPSGQQGVHKWWAEQQFLPDSRHDWGGVSISFDSLRDDKRVTQEVIAVLCCLLYTHTLRCVCCSRPAISHDGYCAHVFVCLFVFGIVCGGFGDLARCTMLTGKVMTILVRLIATCKCTILQR